MYSRSGQGTNRSDTGSYREDLQRRRGREGTVLCAVMGGALH